MVFQICWSLSVVFHTGMRVPGMPSLTCQNHSSLGIERKGSCLKFTGVTTMVPP